MTEQPEEEQNKEEQLEEEQTSEAEPEIAEAEDVEKLRQTLAEVKAKAEANLAGWQRAQADFINYKRRTEQERGEIGQFANSMLILHLLPILDDWERALAAIPDEAANTSWVEGIKLIEHKLRAVLEAEGLSPITALGEPFDPTQHEAAMPGKGKEGMVVEELRKGYKFRDRVIRPARVVVGNGEEEEKEE